MNITRKIKEYNKKRTKNRLNFFEFFKSCSNEFTFTELELLRIIADQEVRTNTVYFRQDTLALMVARCRATVNRALKSLQKKGVIKKIYRHNRSCLYRVVFIAVLSCQTLLAMRLCTASFDTLWKMHVTRYNKQSIFLEKKLAKKKLINPDGSRTPIGVRYLCTELAIKVGDGDLHQSLIFTIFPEHILREAYYLYRQNKKQIKRKHGFIFARCVEMCTAKGIEPRWEYYYDNKEHLDLFELEKKEKEQDSNKTKGEVSSKEQDAASEAPQELTPEEIAKIEQERAERQARLEQQQRECAERLAQSKRVNATLFPSRIFEDRGIMSLLQNLSEKIKNQELQAKLDLSPAFGVE